MTSSRAALLVVEPDFLNRHIGVRRVILYYWRRLVERGFTVHLATPKDGELKIGQAPSLKRIEALTANKHQDVPDWRSRYGVSVPVGVLTDPGSRLTVRWTTRSVSAVDYAVSVVTNPWLCARGLPDAPFTAGIVYDMVPNLLACGALNLGVVGDIYGFARDHDLGYQAYLRNAQSIHCISDSARADFSSFYGLTGAELDRISTVFPFEISPNSRVRWRSETALERPRVLLVNVLDPRKNFSTIRDVLVRVGQAGYGIDIDIVGRERMAMSRVRAFLGDLATLAATVNWYRVASDTCLARLYADADLLLFPSLYEGLGLPILEAQAHGTPVVSSNTSSGAEINLNPDLSVDPLEPAGLAAAIISIFDLRGDFLEGQPLQAALARFLENRNTLPSSWQPT